jgi:hypothetical protein
LSKTIKQAVPQTVSIVGEPTIKVTDLAHQHSCHPDTVKNWIVRNNVPVLRVGNRIRIPVSSAAKFGRME